MEETTLSRRSRPTMREVASLAGVSLKTVSRVVNDERGVSAEVRDRVRRAVEHLGYRPNLAASALRRSGTRTGLVGVLTPGVTSPFAATVVEAAHRAAHDHGYEVLVASTDGDVARERALLGDLVARAVSALVVVPTSDRLGFVKNEVPSETTVVVAGRPPRGLVADSVALDDGGGARMAAAHLRDHGHHRIACLVGTLPPAVSSRIRAGLAPGRDVRHDPPAVVTGLTSVDDAAAAAQDLLARRDGPTGIVAACGTTSAGVLRALADRKADGPVAVVGLEDVAWAELTHPPLTTVRHDVARLGAAITDVLGARLGGDAAPTQQLTLRGTLVARGSGEVPGPGR